MMNLLNRNPVFRRRQQGAITMISAVLILILLTEMVIYAVQTGVFEQRKSSNELRQKTAFHMADSAIQQAKQFIQANITPVPSSKVDLFPLSGADGWLADGSEKRWWPCAGITDLTHPCFAESNAALRAGSYFYGVDANGDDAIQADEQKLPLDPKGLAATPSTTEQVGLYALLCMLNIDRSKDPVVQGCTTVVAEQDERYFIVTLAARGEADCINSIDCKAEALVSEKIAGFGPGGGDGGPGVPLTARTAVPLLGTVEIVPNPNGGGIGVPISTWANANASCPDPLVGDPVDPQSGSFSTCERHEWYGVGEFPDDYKCPTNNCSCSKTKDKLLSYAQGNEKILGMDIVIDPAFPCDIFKFTFGIAKANYAQVRDSVDATHRLSSCDGLNEDSSGTYWISGPNCDIPTKTTVGTVDKPVFLISAAADTRVHGSVFGVLFVTDAENPAAEFTGNGKGTIYGAAVMDAEMDHFNGTFQIVYLDNVVEKALETGGVGGVQGGWTDFHASWQ